MIDFKSLKEKYWLKAFFWALLTYVVAFSLRMLEWSSWQNPEYRIGTELLLATHDAYHWVAGAEGFGRSVGHPMSEMLRILSELFNIAPATIAFWFPTILASFVAVIVFLWVWALGSIEAGFAAGILASLTPGFLARTLVGYYDTDLITLFFPLAMTLIPATWAMRYMLVPSSILKAFKKIVIKDDHIPLGNPLHWKWILLLGLSGTLSWWTQEWHSIFPYLVRYNVILLFFMAIIMGLRGRKYILLLGALAYILPSLIGIYGFLFSLLLIYAGSKKGSLLKKVLANPILIILIYIFCLYLVLQGSIFTTIVNHINAYLKPASDIKVSGSGINIIYPSVAQSIIEVQDLDILTLLPYFHPWMEVSIIAIIGFIVVMIRKPGALFLFPLFLLSLLGTKLGGRMVMFGAPIMAIGFTLPLYWILQRLLRVELRGAFCGIVTSVLVLSILVFPFLDMIPAMSQGPMINRRHAEALNRARTVTPEGSMLWLWWDFGYAAHHFARRNTIADGAEHAGPSLYLPAAVFATDNPRFARQLIRYTALKGNIAANVFKGLDNNETQKLMDSLRSSSTPLVEVGGRIFIITSFEMLRLGYWISNFGTWDFVKQKGENGALSIVPQKIAYRLDSGEVRLEDSTSSVYPISISVFDETGLTKKNYVEEWFQNHPQATTQEQQEFLKGRRNINFLFNRVTDEKLVMDEKVYNSLMVQLLLCDPQDQRFSPYFKLVYDNVFARIYEVL